MSIELASQANSTPIRCSVVDVDIPLTEDTVLLELESPLPVGSVLPIVSSHIPAGLEWSSFGYPRVRGAIGARLSGTSGRTINPDLATWDVELVCDAASVLTSYKGASGSPVVVAGAVRAMLQERVDGALGAISLRRLQPYLQLAGIELQGTEASTRLPPRLKEQLSELVPNTRTASSLELAIAEREDGYVVLSGTPGSGKTLFVAGFDPVEQSLEVVCRYFAGEPDLNNGPPALQRLPRTFADWLCQEAALLSPGAAPVPRDATTADCAAAVARNLRAISESLSKRNAVGVLIIDDAIGTIGEARASLLETLPVALPPNVSIVLTTTDEAALVALMPDAKISQRVQMEPLPRRDAEALAVQLLPEGAPYSVAMRIADAANGHPLVLALLVRQYGIRSTDPVLEGALVSEAQTPFLKALSADAIVAG